MKAATRGVTKARSMPALASTTRHLRLFLSAHEHLT